MQLKVSFPARFGSASSEDEDVTVRSENDIRTAGFAAARSVRTWLRNMPFVPDTGDLHFNIYAEVVPDKESKASPAPNGAEPRPKRKRKASK